MNKNIKYLLVFVFSITWINVDAQPSNSIINNLQTAVVRVQSGDRIGSGFLWKNEKWIVTTLHLIENRFDIEVTLSNDVKSAKVIKILKEQDLVLLELESASYNCHFLNDIETNPNLNSNLYTMGYNGNGNINAIIDRTLRLGFNSKGTLSGLLPKKIKDALSLCKRPDPSIEILYLEGTLLPGFSGAPIINNYGELVGIADGGLEEGASSISWGIKAIRLNNLINSHESFPNFTSCGQGGSVSFSSENILEDKNIDYLYFKKFKFIKTKVRSVQEMISTIDDPAGLYQIINGYSMNNNVDFMSFRYDIYEDIISGITFCVPEGTLLNVQNDLIVGNFENADFKIVINPEYIQILNPNPLLRYATTASVFQQKIVAIDGGILQYQKDFNLSYRNGPILRYDGIKVNREAYRGFLVTTNNFGQLVNTPKTYSFQTHIGRGNYYMGAAALNMSSTIEDSNNLSFCLQNGQCNGQFKSAGCEKVCGDYRLFSQLVIGVHMGGFSNNYNRR